MYKWKGHYIYRLYSVMNVLENAFGLFVQKRRLYYTPVRVKVQFVKSKSTFVFHKYLRSKPCDSKYCEYL